MVSDAILSICGAAIKQIAPYAMELFDLSQKESNMKKQFDIQRENIASLKTTFSDQRFADLSGRVPKRGKGKCSTCGIGSGLKEVGHASWLAMHGAVKMYPETPAPADQVRMRAYLMGIIENFPCEDCVSHSRAYLGSHPLDFTSRAALEQGLCEFHNAVRTQKGQLIVVKCG